MIAVIWLLVSLSTIYCDDGQWPFGPLSTSGRDIVNSRGERVKWAGVNWPLSLETMLPEGIEWRSVDGILDFMSDAGFNFIRMGYASQMVDDLYETNGADVTIYDSLSRVLGSENGRRVCNNIIKQNSQWNSRTTRFQVWSDIINKAAARKLYVHPDLHVGKASWCCSSKDGNAWIGDVNFPASNWIRAVMYIALFAKEHPNIVSMSLRNEPRSSDLQNLDFGWATLTGNFTQGADAIHSMNPGLLITWAGINYDSDLSVLTTGSNYANIDFNLKAHAWSNKLIWELHRYGGENECDKFSAQLYRDGANALNIAKPRACGSANDCPNATNIAPVLISEFGKDEDTPMSPSHDCLRDFLLKERISWVMWTLAGSYRIRSGKQDYDENWGLTNHNWSDWRNPGLIQSWWKPFINQTLVD